MVRILRTGSLLLAVAFMATWWLTRPQAIEAGELPDHVPDLAAGERMFWAGGCASCHATPVDGKRARGENKLLLGGGEELDTPYGVFRVPNISPHPEDGIGAWSTVEFVNAMRNGVSPDGAHYYPSFPYGSYTKMATEDVIDLKAYLDTLPLVEGKVPGHELQFPWSVRRGIGVWKRLYLDVEPVLALDTDDPQILRGQELVEGAGHCGECHTPRNRFGGLLADRWLGGATSPEGEGRIPNITPGGKSVADWSARNISYYLQSGFTPDFDTVGGTMVAVQENIAQLPEADRDAIAAYLKSIPSVE